MISRVTKRVRESMKRLHLLRIWVVFLKRVLSGYRVYAGLISTYGEDAAIFGTAWRGIGDYYICASYLPAWLQKNEIERFVFLTPGGGEQKTLDLFPTGSGHTIRLLSGEEGYSYLLFFRAFLGADRCQFYNFHHQQSFPSSETQNISRGMLQGFRGLNMADFYLACGLGLPSAAVKKDPVFSTDHKKLQRYFQEYDLQPGRTVLIAPYSTGLAEYLPPDSFWIELVGVLKTLGYSVCTNCAGDEKPIMGTTGLCVPLSEIVPFLNMAGGFIGIRSGLCDVISTSDCKKVILHTYEAKWWPVGRSVGFTGLVGMGLCDDAVEIEVQTSEPRSMIPQITQIVAGGK